MLVVLLAGLLMTVLVSSQAAGQGEQADEVTVTFRLMLDGAVPGSQVFSLGLFPSSGGDDPGLVGPALDHFCGYGTYGECTRGKAYTVRLDVARGSSYVYHFRRQPLDGSQGELLCRSTATFRRDTLIRCRYETPRESPSALPRTGAGGTAGR
jgi:hypothetical protein